MSKSKLKGYRTLLRKRRTEVEQELAVAIRDRDRLIVEAPDEIEAATLTLERELAVTNIDRLSKLLRDIKDAQARVAEGSYGICLECEEDIPAVRLRAVPWARYCVSCQESLHEGNSTATEALGNGKRLVA